MVPRNPLRCNQRQRSRLDRQINLRVIQLPSGLGQVCHNLDWHHARLSHHALRGEGEESFAATAQTAAALNWNRFMSLFSRCRPKELCITHHTNAARQDQRAAHSLTDPNRYCTTCAAPGFTVPQSVPIYFDVIVLSIVMCIVPPLDVASAVK